MAQLWTITRLSDGAVLGACVPTPSFGSHPKDNGWDWDAATQRATRIDAAPDVATQTWSGAAWVPDTEGMLARAWTAVRDRRDALLAASDATQLVDRPEELRLAWQPYRQALRQLPEQGSDPHDLEWPVPPT